MVHLRILGALLAFVAIAQCRDPNPAPPQPTPDPGPSGIILEAQLPALPAELEEKPFEEVRL